MKITQHFVGGPLDGRTIRGSSNRKHEPKRISVPCSGQGYRAADYERFRGPSVKKTKADFWYRCVAERDTPSLTSKELQNIKRSLRKK